MKKMWKDWQGRAEEVLQQDLATKDRSSAFRIFVIALLAVNIFLITFCILQAIS
jgi:hypothetical protein